MTNKINPKSYQTRLFWFPILISIITLIIVLYNSNSNQNNRELKEYIKTYIDSTNTIIQKDIGNASIEVLDIIYGDSSINKKSKTD